MALDSSSTLAEVQAEYDDTVSYDSPPDVSLARRHLAAIRILRRRVPREGGLGAMNATYEGLAACEEAVVKFLGEQEYNAGRGVAWNYGSFGDA